MADYPVQKLVNQQLAYEGAATPPKAAEGFRVPAIDSLRVVRQENKLGGSLITLAFNEENTPNKTLYYIMAYTGDDVFNWSGQNVKDVMVRQRQTIQGPYIAFGSPATIFIPAEVEKPAFITITTRLPSGVVSELQAQPGVSVMVAPRGAYYKNYTAAATIPYDEMGHVAFCSGTFTMTLPNINQVIDGFECEVKNTGSGTITVAGNVSAQTIDGAASETISTANEAHRYLADKLNLVWRII
jgi:hypothetical protein